MTALQVEAPVQKIYEGMTPWPDLLDRLTARGFALSGVFPVSRDARLRLIEVDLVLVRSAEWSNNR